jgi:uncharacterized protein
MNLLLINNEVVFSDVLRLAEIVARFHEKTTLVHNVNILNITEAFRELGNESRYLSEQLGGTAGLIIDHAITCSDQFVHRNHELFLLRLVEGYYRDCHGDLHSRNIFLDNGLPKLFDCIEFNDAFREIDVLNDIAFLCMDFDSFGRQDLSDLFLSYYNKLFPCMNTHEEYLLFIYYKSYRANVRAKVNSLRAKSEKDENAQKKILAEANKYLLLLNDYISVLNRELVHLSIEKLTR